MVADGGHIVSSTTGVRFSNWRWRRGGAARRASRKEVKRRTAVALWTAVLFIVVASIAPSLQASTTMAARPRQEEKGHRQRHEKGNRQRHEKGHRQRQEEGRRQRTKQDGATTATPPDGTTTAAPPSETQEVTATEGRRKKKGRRQRTEQDAAGQVSAEFSVTNPITIQLGTGNTTTYLDTSKDYVVKLPSGTKKGSTAIIGGRNVLIDGGHIAMPQGSTDITRRAIYLKNVAGTARIEDVFIEGTDGAYFDAIAIAAPNAVVEVINVRVEDVRGRASGYHGDIIQPFGGVKKLYVDRLTGRSNYQGFYLEETGGQIGSVSLNNVNLAYDANSYDTTTFLVWWEACSTYPVTLRNVYIQPRSGQTVGRSAVYPNTDRPADCRARQSGNDVTWPTIGAINGKVIQGRPSTGDFVPAGSVG
jgi:hypothetical protein